MPLGLLDQLKRILAFADIVADKIVADKIVCEEVDLLEEVIPKMYEVMHKVAEVSCDYVKHVRWSAKAIRVWRVLMAAARTVGGSAYQETIEEMDRELRSVIKDFDRALNVEALRRTKETGEHSFSQYLDESFSTVPRRAAPFA